MILGTKFGDIWYPDILSVADIWDYSREVLVPVFYDPHNWFWDAPNDAGSNLVGTHSILVGPIRMSQIRVRLLPVVKHFVPCLHPHHRFATENASFCMCEGGKCDCASTFDHTCWVMADEIQGVHQYWRWRTPHMLP